MPLNWTQPRFRPLSEARLRTLRQLMGCDPWSDPRVRLWLLLRLRLRWIEWTYPSQAALVRREGNRHPSIPGLGQPGFSASRQWLPGQPAAKAVDEANAYLIEVFPQLTGNALAFAYLEALFCLDEEVAESARVPDANMDSQARSLPKISRAAEKKLDLKQRLAREEAKKAIKRAGMRNRMRLEAARKRAWARLEKAKKMRAEIRSRATARKNQPWVADSVLVTPEQDAWQRTKAAYDAVFSQPTQPSPVVIRPKHRKPRG